VPLIFKLVNVEIVAEKSKEPDIDGPHAPRSAAR
jgi:hypothetical protein